MTARLILDTLLDNKRLRAALGNPRQITLAGSDRYPRLTADLDDDTHIVVLVKYTGSLNASRFRHWLTAAPKEWEAAANPPADWHYFIAQVGRLPDDSPWWIALYDMQHLRELEWVAESVPMDNGHFLRVNPAELPESARPVTHDFQTLTMDELIESKQEAKQEEPVRATGKPWAEQNPEKHENEKLGVALALSAIHETWASPDSAWFDGHAGQDFRASPFTPMCPWTADKEWPNNKEWQTHRFIAKGEALGNEAMERAIVAARTWLREKYGDLAFAAWTETPVGRAAVAAQVVYS